MPQKPSYPNPDTRLLDIAAESRVYRRLQTTILKTTVKELLATRQHR